MTTKGDQILDRSLSKVGGKGLFVKELEVALEEGRADIAVHSLKDVPMELPEGFALACVMEREDPRDAWCPTHYASAGSAAPGRGGGHIQPAPGGAAAGHAAGPEDRTAARQPGHAPAQAGRGPVRRHRAGGGGPEAAGPGASASRHIFEPTEMLPAAGQGALGIEVRSRPCMTCVTALAPLAHRPPGCAVAAERAVSRAMGGSCSMPLAAYAVLDEKGIHLKAAWGDPEGSTALVTAEGSTPTLDLIGAAALGDQVAGRLRASGAR
jgi:hydroxymethylbilane synthase